MSPARTGANCKRKNYNCCISSATRSAWLCSARASPRSTHEPRPGWQQLRSATGWHAKFTIRWPRDSPRSHCTWRRPMHWPGSVRSARSNLEEARRSVMDLRAAPLQNHTLPEALSALIASEITAYQQPDKGEAMPVVQYTYTPSPDFPPLPARIEAGLYRVAQEALANVRKHAAAQSVEMTLTADETHVYLVIQDDGC